MIYLYNEWDITPAIKKNEILPFTTTYMDPEGVRFSGISQEDKHSILALTCGIQK